MTNESFALCRQTSIDRAKLIGNAEKRVIYGGPGVTPDEISALLQTHERLAEGSVLLMLDLSLDTIRSGYWGDDAAENLARIGHFGSSAQMAKGMRLGLLVIDDRAFVFVPTPQRIEPEDETAQEPNALFLAPDVTDILLNSILKPRKEIETPRAEITAADIQAVQAQVKEQKIQDPKQSRLADVLRERLKIIQFEVRGYRIGQKSLQLPDDVIAVLGSEKEGINERLRASWRLFERETDEELDKAQRGIEKELTNLKKKYLKRFGHYGYGLIVDNRAAFDDTWTKFQENKVDPYRKLLLERVEDLVEKSKDLFRTLLLERIQSGRLEIPDEATLIPKSKEAKQRDYVEWLVTCVKWPNAEQVSEGVIFKLREYDVTEHLLHDSEFVEIVEKTFRCRLEDLLGKSTNV